MTSRRYTLEEFRKAHGSTVSSSLIDVFPEPFLLITLADDSKLIYPLPNRNADVRVSLGSNEDCDIPVAFQEAAPVHLHFHFHKIIQQWCVEDQGSDFGTKVDGTQITPFSMFSLTEENIVEVGPIKIQLKSIKTVSSLLGESSAPKPVSRTESPQRKTAAGQRHEPKKLDSRKFVTTLTGNRHFQLMKLRMRFEQLGEEGFKKSFTHCILVLRKIVMKSDQPAIYDAATAALDDWMFWPIRLAEGRRSFVIGRAPDCDLRLQAKVISKHHVKLLPEGYGWALQDLGSVNRAYLNGHIIEKGAAKSLQSNAALGISAHIHLMYYTPDSLVALLKRPA